MATEDISAGTAADAGTPFSLAAGTSRVYYCDPPLASGERCFLQISNDSGTTYFDVGDICTVGNPVSTVTAQGTGASYFRVSKGPTATSTSVWYD